MTGHSPQIAIGGLSWWSVFTRRYALARLLPATNVALLLIGWATAQYPYLVGDDFTYREAAAFPAMLKASLLEFAGGSVFLIPSLILLFAVFKGLNPAGEQGESEEGHRAGGPVLRQE